MATPAPKLRGYADELGDHSIYVSEFRLQQIAKDCERDIRLTRSSNMAAELHQVAGLAYVRLKLFERALDHFRIGAQAAPQAPVYPNNIAATLNELGRWSESLEIIETTLAQIPAARTRAHLYAVGAFALARLGRWREAAAMFGEACTKANHESAIDLFMLATHAAAINDDILAAVFASQFLAVKFGNGAPVIDPVAFIEAAPQDWWTGLALPTTLQNALRRIIDDPVGRALAATPPDDEPLSAHEEAALARAPGERIDGNLVRARLFPS